MTLPLSYSTSSSKFALTGSKPTIFWLFLFIYLDFKCWATAPPLVSLPGLGLNPVSFGYLCLFSLTLPLRYSNSQSISVTIFKGLPRLEASPGFFGLFSFISSHFSAELKQFTEYPNYFLSSPRLEGKPRMFWLFLFISSQFTAELQLFTKYLSYFLKVCSEWELTQNLMVIFVYLPWL